MTIIPKNSQLLILPIDTTYIGAGFKNAKYPTSPNHSFPHYGVDFSFYRHGTFNIRASGNGRVLGVEMNSNSIGGVVVVRYDNVYNPTTKRVGSYIFRYMHLLTLPVRAGQVVTKETTLGAVQSIHKWYNHLHLEVDTDVKYPFHTPQVAEASSRLLVRSGATDLTMINPIDLLVVGQFQTGIVHPDAIYATTKDVPRYFQGQFSYESEVIVKPVVPQPPTSGQRLILPNNSMRITCSYKNKPYVNRFNIGEHYGLDFVGLKDSVLWSSGTGKVLAVGNDALFGNFVVVNYTNVYNHKTGKTHDIVFRYFHMATVSVKSGQATTKDTRLGIIGSTGTYTTGVHCHLEADTDVRYWNYTPTLSSNSTRFRPGLRGVKDTTLNPINLLHVKTSHPDNQTISRNINVYTDTDDITVPKII